MPPGSDRKTRTRADIKARRQKRREAQNDLRQQELANGLERATNPSASNRVSRFANVEEERADRETVTAQFFDTIRSQLPALLQSFARIKDYGNPKKIKHQLTMVLVYGFLCFVLQVSSRRAANRELTGPVLREHLRKLFPDLETLTKTPSTSAKSLGRRSTTTATSWRRQPVTPGYRVNL